MMTRRPRRAALVGAAVLGLALGVTGCTGRAPVTLGLITKQQDNPYWHTMTAVAQETAGKDHVNLLVASGSSDVDVEAQRAALASMVRQGASGILLAPNSSSGLNEAIEEARAAGVTVIALDTPVVPADVVNATYATDNERAGRVVGAYAAAKVRQLGLTPKVALLNLAPGIASGEARREGFLAGFGIAAGSPQIVAEFDTEGNRERGRAAMAQAWSEHPDITVVYTVNEPAALGALDALRAAGADLARVVVVSIDGGCSVVRSVLRGGDLDATAMQFPQNMAREGVSTLAAAARGGPVPSGSLDTGVELVTGDPAPGVPSRDVPFAVRTCWG